MKCIYCGGKISSDSLFCPHCGKKVIRSIICPNCQEENDLEANYCKKCGASLKDVDEKKKVESAENNKKTKSVDNNKLNWIFSIIGMSSMLLAIILIVSIMFAPFLHSDFFDNSSFTTITYYIDTFSYAKSLILSGETMHIVNASLVLVVQATIVILGIVFLANSIPAFITAIKEKKYIDLSKKAIVVYLLYLFLFIYFVNFALVSDIELLATSINGGQLFLLIFVPILLSFNIFVKLRLQAKKQLASLIVFCSLTCVSFILCQIVLFNLGGIRFTLSGFYYPSAEDAFTKNYYLETGNLGFVSFFLSKVNVISVDASGFVISAIAYSGISFLFEILILVTLLLFTFVILKNSWSISSLFEGLIFSVFTLISSICTLVFNGVASTVANKIDNANYFMVVHSVNHPENLVVIIVLASLLSVLFIVCFIINKIMKKKETNYEKAN